MNWIAQFRTLCFAVLGKTEPGSAVEPVKRFAEEARVLLVEWFGPPEDASLPYQIVPWHTGGCTDGKRSGQYLLLINLSQSQEQIAMETAHEMYHRVTFQRVENLHPVWLNEMLAILSEFHVLERTGYADYAASYEGLLKQPLVAPIDGAAFRALKTRKSNTSFSKGSGYPDRFFESAYRMGKALENIVGWDQLTLLGSGCCLEAWLEQLPQVQRNGVLRILDFPGVLDGLPVFYEAQMALGISMRWIGRYDQSLSAFRLIASASRENYPYHYQISITLQLMGNWEEAVAHAKRALEFSTLNLSLCVHLGRVLLEAGQVDQAIPVFERAAFLHPDSAVSHYYLGVALYKQGNSDLARQVLAHAVELGGESYRQFVIRNVPELMQAAR